MVVKKELILEKKAYENMAKEMLKRNVSIEDIMEISKLSKEDILNIKNNM